MTLKETACRTSRHTSFKMLTMRFLSRKIKTPLGGRPSVSYYLTVSCLEHLIARKERRVFEVYSQVFHQAMDNASSQPQVLRDIRNILSQLEDGAELNFELSEYTDAKGVAETNFGPGSYKDMYNLMK